MASVDRGIETMNHLFKGAFVFTMRNISEKKKKVGTVPTTALVLRVVFNSQ